MSSIYQILCPNAKQYIGAMTTGNVILKLVENTSCEQFVNKLPILETIKRRHDQCYATKTVLLEYFEYEFTLHF